MARRPKIQTPAGPYPSGRDLPSVAELLEQIRGMKALTRVIGRDQRAKVIEIERQVHELAENVDRFYSLMGPRHWIFHDRLNAEKVGALIGLDPDGAEQAFIEIYQDQEALRLMIMPLRRFPAMQSRMDLIEKARVDYQAGRFYSTVLVLLTVMDGFVNELEPGRRRGLHARPADELQAWDSVVGHHLGLAHAHKTFTKTVSKTSSDPVFELHRNGIIHGTLLNYDNVVVATKAWNRLFAVADWAASIEKQKVEPKADPTWREIFGQLAANARAKTALEAWQPSAIDADDPAFEHEGVCQCAVVYLEAWVAKNYGAMATLISPTLREETPRKTAGMVREACEMHSLSGFSVVRAVFEAPAVCEIDVELIFASAPEPGRMRWIREASDGSPATPDVKGEWYLYLWGPWEMLNRGRGDNDAN